MNNKKRVSFFLSVVFLIASAVMVFLTLNTNSQMRSLFSRASSSAPVCPTGTELLFPVSGSLAYNKLVGVGGSITFLKPDTAWTVGSQNGQMLAVGGQLVTVKFPKEVVLDTALIFDNDHTAWTINNVALTSTTNNVWASPMKLGLKTTEMIFNGNGDSVHFNVCVGSATSTPTSTPKPPPPTKTVVPTAPTCVPRPVCVSTSLTPCVIPTLSGGGTYCPQPPTKTPAPTCIPLPTCAWSGANPRCAPTPPTGGTFCPQPTVSKTPTPTIEVGLCSLDADIAIVLDRSGSMNSKESDGRTKIDWAKEAADKFVDKIASVPGMKARISIISFGAQGNDGTGNMSADRNSILHISLSSDMNAVHKAIASVKFITDGTCIECGLRIANEQLTTKTRNRILILLSDGRSNHTWDGTSTTVDANPAAITEAGKGRASGIDYFVLGYGSTNSINEVTLKAIAEDPTHYQYKPNTADWADAFINVFEKVCTEVTPTVTPTPADCKAPLKVTNVKINCPSCSP